MRRALVAICCVSALAGIAAGSASAATWSGRQLTGEAAKVALFGISCPTRSLCVAVGGNNTISSSTDPGGDVSKWSTVYAGEGAQATGDGIFPGRQVRGVSCPSTQLCVAATFEGNVYTATEPTGSAAAWAVTDIDGGGPNTHFYGISCPTTTLCVAVAGGGKIATSTNPTGGPLAWSTAQLDPGLTLRAVSCASASLCVATGDDGQVVASGNPTAGAAAWQQIPSPVGSGHIWGVSCALPSLCVGGNSVGNVLSSTNPLAPAPTWQQVPGGGTVQITAASCVSAQRCVLVDNNGDVLTSTNPTGGRNAWTFANVLPYVGAEEFGAVGNHMFGVSCPLVGFCAVTANHGQIYTSNDPFAEPREAVRKPGKQPNKNKKRPKRPRALIATAPPPGAEIERGRYAALYRFYVKNRRQVQIRGFSCRIDGGPERRCRSPKRYRLGLGVHRFSVRAIGWTGLKGPAATHRFEVCRPTDKGLCLGDLPS